MVQSEPLFNTQIYPNLKAYRYNQLTTNCRSSTFTNLPDTSPPPKKKNPTPIGIITQTGLGWHTLGHAEEGCLGFPAFILYSHPASAVVGTPPAAAC